VEICHMAYGNMAIWQFFFSLGMPLKMQKSIIKNKIKFSCFSLFFNNVNFVTSRGENNFVGAPEVVAPSKDGARQRKAPDHSVPLKI